MSETVAVLARHVEVGDHLLHGGFVTEILGGPALKRFKTTMGASGMFRADSTVWLDVEDDADSVRARSDAES